MGLKRAIIQDAYVNTTDRVISKPWESLEAQDMVITHGCIFSEAHCPENVVRDAALVFCFDLARRSQILTPRDILSTLVKASGASS